MIKLFFDLFQNNSQVETLSLTQKQSLDLWSTKPKHAQLDRGMV